MSTNIDASTIVGKLRLRCGDIGAFQILSDEIYNQTYIDNNNDIVQTTRLCCQYILGCLSFQSRSRLDVIETYGNQVFDQYLRFLKLIIYNPSDVTLNAPTLIYAPSTVSEHPLLKFKEDFKENYVGLTQDETMELTAINDSEINLDPDKIYY